MRRLLVLSVLVVVAGCGAPEERSSREDLTTYEVSENAAAPAPQIAPDEASEMRRAPSAGPNVSVTAAPGVAFNYRYAFRLAPERIAAVQEHHARACEQLGVARCRITGMRYRVVSEREVEAMLAFKLEPSIARRFGQAGVEAVTRSEGVMVDAEISGTDVGTSIRAAGRSLAELEAELSRIEQRIARGGLRSDERSQLEYEAQRLREQIRAVRANREEQQESLATTPMVFEYGSGDFVPGYDARPSFRRAAGRAGDNFVEGVYVLFVIVVTLLPWALIALLLWAAFRYLRRRFGARGVEMPATEAEVSPPVA